MEERNAEKAVFRDVLMLWAALKTRFFKACDGSKDDFTHVNEELNEGA